MSVTENLPNLHVALDGRALDEQDALALTRLHVIQRFSVPTLCELTFSDLSDPVLNAEKFLPGAAVRISVADCDEPLFVGEVTAIEHDYGPARQRNVRVRCYDRLHRLRKTQSVRPFADLTLPELAAELLQGAGLDTQFETDGPVWPKIVQWRQSDLELLTETAQRCGLFFTLREDTVHFLTLEGAGDALPLEMGRSLIEAQIVANTDPACRSVQSLGWDPWLAEGRRGEAATPRVGRQVDFDAGPGTVSAPGERTLVNPTVQSDEQADVLAQAELDSRVAGEVTLSGTAQGDARLQPGKTVSISGVAAPLSGTYVLTAVSHTIDREHGFRSTIDTAPPQQNSPPRNTISTLGVVADVDDPEKLGRVKVGLPAFGDIESDWLEVLVPGAGEDKGIVALPDVDDRVLVLMSGEDPAQGTVLGGLYGSAGPPDDGVIDARTKRYTVKTQYGQRLYLDGDRDRVRLENSGGNYLQVSPGRARLANSGGSFIEFKKDLVRLHASTNLELEAPGNTIVIRGAAIEFKTG